MAKYHTLITKALINRGGNKTEDAIYKILSGDFDESILPVSKLWKNFEVELQQRIIETLNNVSGLGIKDKFTEQQVVSHIIEYMSVKSGRLTFIRCLSTDEINSTPDDEHEMMINDVIAEKRELLLNKEKHL